MNDFTIHELKELILYKFTKKSKKKIKEPPKKKLIPNYDREYKENPDNLDDFYLDFGLKYLEPKKTLKVKEKTDDDDDGDWFDIGAGHSNVQSVLIPKKKFSKKEAINYIKKHFQFKKIDEKPNYYRFRQFDPKKHAHYFSKKLKNGVILVIDYNDEIGGSLPVDTIYKSIKNGYTKASGKNNIINIDGYVISMADSSNEVQVYINFKERRIIINFVGTYSSSDWYNNFKYVIGGYDDTRRFNHAKNVLEKILRLYPTFKISLVGHSQSAVITRKLGKEFGNKIFEIINLNGANLREQALPNEYNIRSSIDIVSALTRNNDRLITIPRDSLNLLKEHSPDILNRLNPTHEIGVEN